MHVSMHIYIYSYKSAKESSTHALNMYNSIHIHVVFATIVYTSAANQLIHASTRYQSGAKLNTSTRV